MGATVQYDDIVLLLQMIVVACGIVTMFGSFLERELRP
jgi:hypothetical protein